MNSEKESVCAKNDFIDRQKHLNDQLLLIEKSLNKHINHRSSHVPKLEDLSVAPYSKNKIKGFRGRQSMFKRPEGPAPRSNIQTIPGYRRHPTKWTCYSLDNVSDMSNESNSEAALSFLKELKQRKRNDLQKKNTVKNKLKICEEAMDIDIIDISNYSSSEIEENFNNEDNHKNVFLFRKPITEKEGSNELSKPEFRGNKIIMPEYEFGSKKASKKKKSHKTTLEKIHKRNEMKLDHLQEYDNEEE